MMIPIPCTINNDEGSVTSHSAQLTVNSKTTE